MPKEPCANMECISRDELEAAILQAEVKFEAAEELLREIQSAGVSFEDARVAYVEIQVHKETLKAIDAFLKRGTGKEV